MSGFELKDVLTAVGPTASLIFAAWIFLTFLQQRYTSAYERYRALISEYRQGGLHDQRKRSVRDQILLYKLRCERMRWATNIGVVSAIVLIGTLISSALYTVSRLEFLKYVATTCAVAGLLLVVWAAIVVLRENIEIQHASTVS
jgi:hypothetical protein